MHAIVVSFIITTIQNPIFYLIHKIFQCVKQYVLFIFLRKYLWIIYIYIYIYIQHVYFLKYIFLIKCVNVFKNCLKNNFLCLGLLVLVSYWELSFYSYCTNTDRHGQTQQGEWWKNMSGKEEENGKEQKKVGLSCAWFPECQHPLLVLQLPGLKLLTLRPYNLPWATLEHRPLQHSVCVSSVCLLQLANTENGVIVIAANSALLW